MQGFCAMRKKFIDTDVEGKVLIFEKQPLFNFRQANFIGQAKISFLRGHKKLTMESLILAQDER